MKVSIGHNINFKIVFAGSFGVGKTTAIRSISDIDIVDTDVKSIEIDEELINSGKTTTTVGFDYGELRLPDNKTIALYGLPGQHRFGEVWSNILTKDSGVILLLHGSQKDALQECRQWLDILQALNAVRHLTLVVTRLPVPTPKLVLQPYRDLLKEYNPYAPVIIADPRNKNQMIQAVLMTIGAPSW